MGNRARNKRRILDEKYAVSNPSTYTFIIPNKKKRRLSVDNGLKQVRREKFIKSVHASNVCNIDSRGFPFVKLFDIKHLISKDITGRNKLNLTCPGRRRITSESQGGSSQIFNNIFLRNDGHKLNLDMIDLQGPPFLRLVDIKDFVSRYCDSKSKNAVSFPFTHDACLEQNSNVIIFGGGHAERNATFIMVSPSVFPPFPRGHQLKKRESSFHCNMLFECLLEYNDIEVACSFLYDVSTHHVPDPVFMRDALRRILQRDLSPRVLAKLLAVWYRHPKSTGLCESHVNIAFRDGKLLSAVTQGLEGSLLCRNMTDHLYYRDSSAARTLSYEKHKTFLSFLVRRLGGLIEERDIDRISSVQRLISIGLMASKDKVACEILISLDLSEVYNSLKTWEDRQLLLGTIQMPELVRTSCNHLLKNHFAVRLTEANVHCLHKILRRFKKTLIQILRKTEEQEPKQINHLVMLFHYLIGASLETYKCGAKESYRERLLRPKLIEVNPSPFLQIELLEIKTLLKGRCCLQAQVLFDLLECALSV